MKSQPREEKIMPEKRNRRAVVVASIMLVLADANVTLAVPIAPIAEPHSLTPILARMGGRGFHGGGGHYHRGGNVTVGHRNNVVVNRHTNVVVGRGGYYGGWRRPYAWAPGGAIAAGAAIGFMSAATAAAFATSAAPRPGMCWYYTDPFQTSGFWDVCP
jgi:hypothetical protein